jgi:hypothetical protein
VKLLHRSTIAVKSFSEFTKKDLSFGFDIFLYI